MGLCSRVPENAKKGGIRRPLKHSTDIFRQLVSLYTTKIKTLCIYVIVCYNYQKGMGFFIECMYNIVCVVFYISCL